MAGTSENKLKFSDYPGYISKTDPSIYEFLPIEYKTGSGQERLYQIFIQLCIGDHTAAQLAEHNEAQLKTIPIEQKYWDTDPILVQIYGRYWTKTGSLSTQNFRNSVYKNIFTGLGKRTVLKQVMQEAYSEFKKHVSDINPLPTSPHLRAASTNEAIRHAKQMMQSEKFIPPMLPNVCDSIEDWMGKRSKIYAQLKLDGTHYCAFYSEIERRTIGYSRKLNEFPEQPFAAELNKLCAAYPGIIFDGEIYKHGARLQDISGSSRNVKKELPQIEDIEFWIYDIYDKSQPELTFEERYSKYREIEAAGTTHRIKFLEAIPIQDYDQADEIFEKSLLDGYEGLVLKDGTSTYKPGYGHYRTSNCIKMKKYLNCEVLCIGWNSGTGKYAHSLATWRARVTQVSIDSLSNDTKRAMLRLGVEFNVTPEATDVEKKDWYDKFMSDNNNFVQTYQFRYMTIKFLGITDDGIPFQANMIEFRNDIIHNDAPQIEFDDL